MESQQQALIVATAHIDKLEAQLRARAHDMEHLQNRLTEQVSGIRG